MRWVRTTEGLPGFKLRPNPYHEGGHKVPYSEPVLCILRHGRSRDRYRREWLTLDYAPNLAMRTAQHELSEWIRGHQAAGTKNEDADWDNAPKVDWDALDRPETYEPFRWERDSVNMRYDAGERFAVNEVLYWLRVPRPRGLMKLIDAMCDAEEEGVETYIDDHGNVVAVLPSGELEIVEDEDDEDTAEAQP